jgi:hypothetical protein
MRSSVEEKGLHYHFTGNGVSVLDDVRDLTSGLGVETVR